MWVLDHLWDLASDFSVFHRVDNILEMPAPRFFAFAYRIVSYRGVIRGLVEQETQEEQDRTGTPAGTQVKKVELTDLLADPQFAGQFEYARSDGSG